MKYKPAKEPTPRDNLPGQMTLFDESPEAAESTRVARPERRDATQEPTGGTEGMNGGL